MRTNAAAVRPNPESLMSATLHAIAKPAIPPPTAATTTPASAIPPKPAAVASPRAGLLSVIDWRLVAAIGLPLWAFICGLLIAKPAAPSSSIANAIEVAATTVPPIVTDDDTIPMPREVVVRTVVDVVTIPVAVPVITPGDVVTVAEPAMPEFKLPVSEMLPAERCQTFNTKIKFHSGMPEAADEAKLSKKLIMVLHISGNFDDPGFT